MSEFEVLLFGFLIDLLLIFIRKEVLDFIFLCDKSKSYRRRYRKSHGLLYKLFSCFVFNKEYMNDSKYKKYLITHNIISILLFVANQLIAIICVLMTKDIIYLTPEVFYGIYIMYLIPFFVYIAWYFFQYRPDKGFHWTDLLSRGMPHRTFYINLPGLDKSKYIKK